MNPETNGYEVYNLPVDTDGSGKSIEFIGKRTAFVSSDPEQLGDRWTELSLFETKGGKFITQSTGRSLLPGEVDYSTCEVHDSLDTVSEFFKVKGRYTWLSRQLFVEIHKAYPKFTQIRRVD